MNDALLCSILRIQSKAVLQENDHQSLPKQNNGRKKSLNVGVLVPRQITVAQTNSVIAECHAECRAVNHVRCLCVARLNRRMFVSIGEDKGCADSDEDGAESNVRNRGAALGAAVIRSVAVSTARGAVA
jgi:hypothetical protein